MSRIIRIKRSFLRIGVATLALWLLMLTGCVVSLAVDPRARQDTRGMAVIGTVGSFFVGLSAYMILAARRESVTLGDHEITFTGVLGSRTVPLSEVTRAEWRRDLAIKLVPGRGSKTVTFRSFPLVHRVEMVRYFRDRIDPGVQSGWDGSWERYADPTEVTRLLRQDHALLPRLLRLLPLGPVHGLPSGVYPSLGGVPVPIRSSSVVLDWTARGAYASLVVGALLWGGAGRSARSL
jgi:hypothetical protein